MNFHQQRRLASTCLAVEIGGDYKENSSGPGLPRKRDFLCAFVVVEAIRILAMLRIK